GPRHMGAVAVSVVEASTRGAILAPDDVEVWMRAAASVDHRHGEARDAGREARATLTLDPVDAGRQGMRKGPNGPVRGNEEHAGIVLDVRQPLGRDDRGVTLERVAVHVPQAHAEVAGVFGGNSRRVEGVVLQDHDIALWRRGGEVSHLSSCDEDDQQERGPYPLVPHLRDSFRAGLSFQGCTVCSKSVSVAASRRLRSLKRKSLIFNAK